MKNTLKINHANRTIIMDRTFLRNAENTMSPEYAHLQAVRRDYPEYAVIRRHIKKNEKQKHYKGLTYEYMEDYILTHGSVEDIKKNLKDYQEMRLISECHGKAFRYPVIKRWFLDTYPEIANFGVEKDENEIITIETKDSGENAIVEMKASA